MSDLIRPGNNYRLKYDAVILKRDDVVSVFSIERGIPDQPLYGGYCHEKETWEFLLGDYFK